VTSLLTQHEHAVRGRSKVVQSAGKVTVREMRRKGVSCMLKRCEWGAVSVLGIRMDRVRVSSCS